MLLYSVFPSGQYAQPIAKDFTAQLFRLGTLSSGLLSKANDLSFACGSKVRMTISRTSRRRTRTGLAPVSILFEYVFGIRPDAQNKKIVWYVNRLEKHGVKNYPLGDKLIDIICEKRNSIDETPVVTVTGAEDITIEIVWNGKRITV